MVKQVVNLVSDCLHERVHGKVYVSVVNDNLIVDIYNYGIYFRGIVKNITKMVAIECKTVEDIVRIILSKYCCFIKVRFFKVS